jgi:DHA1 family tetracycline resistance protein-like MFS transporter
MHRKMPLKDFPPVLRFLLLTLLTNAISFGIIVPVTPELVMALGQTDLSHATAIGGTLALTYAAFQFLFSPVMGNLSDRYGRRPILLFSLFGLAIEFIVMAFAPNLTWLFIARALSGISGASNASAQSAIADIATPEQRTRLFGLLSAAFGMGFVIGPAIGGVLGEFGVRLPFFAAALLATANLIYGYAAGQETLKPENRRRFEWRRANPLGSLMQVRHLPGILPIALVYFLWQLASLVYPLLWPYFAAARWGWSPGMIGASLGVVGLFMAATNIFVNPKISPKLGERKTALVGMTCGAIGMFAYAAAPLGWMAFPISAFMALQSLTHPALTAMMSRRAKADNQGEVQGFASSVMGLGALAAPLVLSPTQAWFTGANAPFYFDGAAMVLAGLIAVGAVLVLLAIGERE